MPDQNTPDSRSRMQKESDALDALRNTPVPIDQPDLYQQARIALRDVLGMEPDEAMILNTMREISTGTNPTRAAVLAKDFADAEPVHEIAQSILIVTALGTDTRSRVVVSADTTVGLARLRAHAALDSLLDQHGISR